MPTNPRGYAVLQSPHKRQKTFFWRGGSRICIVCPYARRSTVQTLGQLWGRQGGKPGEEEGVDDLYRLYTKIVIVSGKSEPSQRKGSLFIVNMTN